MNTYRAIPDVAGHWVVQWLSNGVVMGNVFGRFDTQVEALHTVLNLARMEHAEMRLRPDTDTPRRSHLE